VGRVFVDGEPIQECGCVALLIVQENGRYQWQQVGEYADIFGDSLTEKMGDDFC
jgi:hypothetical protein